MWDVIFFFHCNLTSQLVHNSLLYTNFPPPPSPEFLFSSFLLGTLSHILIASVSLNHKLNFLLIHFLFPSPSRGMRGTCVYVVSAVHFLLLPTYRLRSSHFHTLQIFLFFHSCRPKCPKFREVQLLLGGLGTSVQFLP